MENFKIREMTYDDIDSILKIEEMCYNWLVATNARKKQSVYIEGMILHETI